MKVLLTIGCETFILEMEDAFRVTQLLNGTRCRRNPSGALTQERNNWAIEALEVESEQSIRSCRG